MEEKRKLEWGVGAQKTKSHRKAWIAAAVLTVLAAIAGALALGNALGDTARESKTYTPKTLPAAWERIAPRKTEIHPADGLSESVSFTLNTASGEYLYATETASVMGQKTASGAPSLHDAVAAQTQSTYRVALLHVGAKKDAEWAVLRALVAECAREGIEEVVLLDTETAEEETRNQTLRLCKIENPNLILTVALNAAGWQTEEGRAAVRSCEAYCDGAVADLRALDLSRGEDRAVVVSLAPAFEAYGARLLTTPAQAAALSSLGLSNLLRMEE